METPTTTSTVPVVTNTTGVEKFFFCPCVDIPKAPFYKELLQWFRKEMSFFSWEHFHSKQPKSWMGIVMSGEKFVARVRVNLGVPSDIKINTNWTFDPTQVVYVTSLYVDPASRKKGYGGKIMNAVLAKIRSFGTKPTVQVWLETEHTNKGASRLYKKLGWKETPPAPGREKLRWFALVRPLGA